MPGRNKVVAAWVSSRLWVHIRQLSGPVTTLKYKVKPSINEKTKQKYKAASPPGSTKSVQTVLEPSSYGSLFDGFTKI